MACYPAVGCVNLSWVVLGYDGLPSYATSCYANCKFMLCYDIMWLIMGRSVLQDYGKHCPHFPHFAELRGLFWCVIAE